MMDDLTLGLAFTWVGGSCPAEAEGTVNGTPFYFRARCGGWMFSIGFDPVTVMMSTVPGFYCEGVDPTCGYMEPEEVRRVVRRCVGEFFGAAGPVGREANRSWTGGRV
jgi:hypothetical protein